jgi:hypothetical protein
MKKKRVVKKAGKATRPSECWMGIDKMIWAILAFLGLTFMVIISLPR